MRMHPSADADPHTANINSESAEIRADVLHYANETRVLGVDNRRIQIRTCMFDISNYLRLRIIRGCSFCTPLHCDWP